jgi:hypothetical protein
MKCGKCGKMAKHRTNECEGIKFKYNSAHAAKVPSNNSDWDDTPQQKTNSKTSKKSKRDEVSSDDDESQDNRNKRPTANVTRAIDFDSHIYSNNAIMGSSKDLNHDLLDKFNQNYIQDRTHDGGAQSFMGVCHSDSNPDVALEGLSKFKRRRDYQEAMAPRSNVSNTSDNGGDNETRPPVLRLRGAGKPEQDSEDCLSGSDLPNLSYDVSESSDEYSNDEWEEEDDCEAFGSDMYSCQECISQPDQQQVFLFPNRDQISVDAPDGSEGDMSSIMECISQSVQQSESLDSNVPVMRLRGGAPKKRRRRIETFQGSSSQYMVQMTVRMETDSRESDNDDDSTPELTAEAIQKLTANTPTRSAPTKVEDSEVDDETKEGS